jgi:hypothetical protein
LTTAPSLGDGAGRVAAQEAGEFKREILRHEALAHDLVEGIDRRGLNPDQHLASGRFGRRDLRDRELIEVSIGLELRGFHPWIAVSAPSEEAGLRR